MRLHISSILLVVLSQLVVANAGYAQSDSSGAGASALENELQQGVKKRFATLVIEAGEQDPPYMSTVWDGDTVVGEITSGGWGYRVDACIGLSMIRADLATEGTALEVEIFGERYPAVVQADQPLWDPANERLRG